MFPVLGGVEGGPAPRAKDVTETVLTSDEQLVETALAGDPEAFGEIVRRWERRIYALTFGILGREEDARDATQETFIAAFRNLGGFRGDAKVSSWLHRIAINQCITRRRRAKVRGETSLEAETEERGAQFASPAKESPALSAEERERSVAVRRAVKLRFRPRGLQARAASASNLSSLMRNCLSAV